MHEKISTEDFPYLKMDIFVICGKRLQQFTTKDVFNGLQSGSFSGWTEDGIDCVGQIISVRFKKKGDWYLAVCLFALFEQSNQNNFAWLFLPIPV